MALAHAPHDVGADALFHVGLAVLRTHHRPAVGHHFAALGRRDVVKARQIVVADARLDALEAEVDRLAERIIAHFLIRFAARSCPPMSLESPGNAPIDLQALFQSTVQAHIEEKFFDVLGHTFALQAFRHRDGRARHDYRGGPAQLDRNLVFLSEFSAG